MEAIVTLLAVGFGTAIAVVAIGFGMLSKNRWRQTLMDVSDALKLQYDPGTWMKAARAFGTSGKFHVTVDSYTTSSGNSSQTYTRIRVETDLPKNLRFKKEGMFSGFTKFFTGDDTEIGIDHFDEAFLLEGRRDTEVLARLGGRARAAMWNAIGGGGAVLKDGTITWTTSGLLKDSGKLIGTARARLELAAALDDRPEGVRSNADALLHHASHDRDVRFRRTCLQALIRELPRAPATAEAVARAAHDADPGMRYLAARTQGTAGHELIRVLLREGGLPEEFRSEAAALIGADFGGGLALAPEGGDAAGRLTVKEDAGRGALSEARAAEPAPARPPRKVKQ